MQNDILLKLDSLSYKINQKKIIDNISLEIKSGDMILFPGEMKHAVYPFKSDVERITLSFNIADFGWIHKETLESKPYKMWCNTYD